MIPQLENLEARMLFNVTTSQTGGTLTITSDADADQLFITETSEGVIRVSGAGGTTVDLQAFRNFFNVNNITVNLAEGDDEVDFTNCSLSGNLAINGSAGRDKIALTKADIGGTTTLQGEGGSDRIFATDSEFTGNVAMVGGNRKDKLRVYNSSFEGTLDMDGGTRRDTLSVDEESEIIGDLIINGGSGNNKIRIKIGI